MNTKTFRLNIERASIACAINYIESHEGRGYCKPGMRIAYAEGHSNSYTTCEITLTASNLRDAANQREFLSTGQARRIAAESCTASVVA